MKALFSLTIGSPRQGHLSRRSTRRPLQPDRRWHLYTPTLRESEDPLAKRRDPDSTERMIRPGFLDRESRQDLIELARNGSAAHRLARRANALVLLDDGMSCEAIAKVLLLDDDTIRTWYRLYEEDGIEGLTNFSYEGSACQLSGEQQEKLKAWVAAALPRATRQVGAWIENEFGVVYEGRSGLIALLHRLGLEYHKPNVIPRKLDEEKQKAFIDGYEKLLNSLGDDEAVLFADQAAAIDRGALSDAGAHPCFPGQRALSSCQARAGMVGPAGATHQAALHPNVLPALEPDRTVMGPHAQKRYAQQVLRNVRPIRRCDAQFSA